MTDFAAPPGDLHARWATRVAALAFLVGVGTTLWWLHATAGERAIAALPDDERAAYVDAECTSLRVQCEPSHGTAPDAQDCRRRAASISSFDDIDAQCREVARAILAPRR